MRRITGQWPANDPDELVTSPHKLGPGGSPGPALQLSNREGLCRLDSPLHLVQCEAPSAREGLRGDGVVSEFTRRSIFVRELAVAGLCVTPQSGREQKG